MDEQGRTQWIAELASTQATLHRLPVPAHATDPVDDEPAAPLWIGDPGLRREAVDAARGRRSEDLVFAHRDYQPFNVLWSDARIADAGAAGLTRRQ